jgi:hypothetical protein
MGDFLLGIGVFGGNEGNVYFRLTDRVIHC